MTNTKADTNKVEMNTLGKGYTVYDDNADLGYKAVKNYIAKNGIEKAKAEYNGVFRDWDKKSAREIFEELVEKDLPFNMIEDYGRMIKAATVNLMRKMIGKAIREVASSEKA